VGVQPDEGKPAAPAESSTPDDDGTTSIDDDRSFTCVAASSVPHQNQARSTSTPAMRRWCSSSPREMSYAAAVKRDL